MIHQRDAANLPRENIRSETRMQRHTLPLFQDVGFSQASMGFQLVRLKQFEWPVDSSPPPPRHPSLRRLRVRSKQVKFKTFQGCRVVR